MEQVLPVGATHLSAGAELRQVAEKAAGVGGGGRRSEGGSGRREERAERRGGEVKRGGEERSWIQEQRRGAQKKETSAAPCRRQVRSSFPSESVATSTASLRSGSRCPLSFIGAGSGASLEPPATHSRLGGVGGGGVVVVVRKSVAVARKPRVPPRSWETSAARSPSARVYMRADPTRWTLWLFEQRSVDSRRPVFFNGATHGHNCASPSVRPPVSQSATRCSEMH